MPQIINTNIASLNAQRNLNKSQSANQTALQRLSSGLRINSAKDDAAGLAISTRFNSQIRGLNVAVRNAGDGISLAQTAEGALGSMNDNLQRVRELAVQSANATNSDVDRDALQAEVSQLIAEISRTADETDFNGRKLLDGTFAATFQIGANAGQTLDVSIAELTAEKLGASDAVGISSQGSNNALQNGDLIINGVAVPPSKSADDTASTNNADASAIAKVAAINSVYDETGVKAVVNENAVAGSEMTGAALTGTLTLNDVTIAITTTTSTSQTRAGVIEAINAVAEQTGITAVDSESDTGGVMLIAEDGRNIEIGMTTITAAATGLAAPDTYEGGFTLVADGDVSEIKIEGGDGTGNGDLKNSGLIRGTYTTTQAQLSTDSFANTDGVDLSGSFGGTTGIGTLGIGFAGVTSAVGAFNMTTAATSEVITISAGGQSVDIGGTASGVSLLGSSGATTGFGADVLAEALSSIDGIEAGAETKFQFSINTAVAAGSSSIIEFYAAGSTGGELLSSITLTTGSDLESIAADINASGGYLVAEFDSAGGTLTITDTQGHTIKAIDTAGTLSVDISAVAETGTVGAAVTSDTSGVVVVGYINETNITDENITSISLSTNRAQGDGAASQSTGLLSAVFTTTGFESSGTDAGTTAGLTSTVTPSLTGLTDGDLVINGVAIQAADPLEDTASATVASDGTTIQTSQKNASAISVAAAINAVSDETRVTAEINETRVVGGDDTTEADAIANAGNYAAGDAGKIYINGVDVGIVSLVDDGSGGIDQSASRAAAIEAINAKTGQTGVTAEDNGSSITLVASEGLNISVAIDNDEANNQGTGVGFGQQIGLDATINGIGEADIGSGTTANTTGTRGTVTEGATYETTYGTITLQSAKQIEIGVGSDGKDELAAMGLTAGKFGGGESGQFLTEIDISTFEGATDALTAIDNAIGAIASQRANLGAIQNRMESTVSNLAITSENLSAANSRIQDADFAAETAELSRTQVLQQAGISILAQANQGPQQVLSLLG